MEELKEGICLRIHNFLVMKSEDGNPDDLKNKMREDFKIRPVSYTHLSVVVSILDL